MTQLFDRLRYWRKQRKYTQQQLSELCGLNQGDISRLEQGRVNPRLQTLVYIIDALGLRIMLVPREKVAEIERIIGAVQTAPVKSLLEKYHLDDSDD